MAFSMNSSIAATWTREIHVEALQDWRMPSRLSLRILRWRAGTRDARAVGIKDIVLHTAVPYG
jgi:hypothetical protein